MSRASRTWWGQQFIQALERFTDPARLGRGRSYASSGRVLRYEIEDGKLTAKVRGSVNPYFGVTKEPIYTTTIALKPIASASWTKAIARLSDKARPVAKLLLNEMPDDIVETFGDLGLHLLPTDERDFTTECSCPDWANPCKHVAAVCYVLASALDRDPFLLFELRGLARDRLRAELAKSTMGRLLASELLDEHEIKLHPVSSYHTRPLTEPPPSTVTYKEFWAGVRRLPPLLEALPRPSVSALLIRKGGDYPPFWPKDRSFVDVMEELYERVRTKSPQMR